MGLTGNCAADLDEADGAGVDVNCASVDPDEVCAGVDEVCAGECVDEVCTIITGTSGLSGSSRSSSIISCSTSSASSLFLKASRIVTSCSNLGRDPLLLTSAKSMSPGHH